MGMNQKNCGGVVSKPAPRVSESRKVRKPLMEKKRRARINQSLNDLKRLLLESNSVKKEGPRPTKLEKADILELTVNHVQKLQQQQQWVDVLHDTSGTDATSRFKAGFTECVRLVREILRAQSHKVEVGIEERLGDHLERCLSSLDVSAVLESKSLCSPRSDSRSSDASQELTSCSNITESVRPKGNTSRMISPQCSPGAPNPVADLQQQQQQPEMTSRSNAVLNLSSLVPVRLSSGQLALVVPEQTTDLVQQLGQVDSPVDLTGVQQHLRAISEQRQVVAQSVRRCPSTEPRPTVQSPPRSFTDHPTPAPLSYKLNANVWRPW